MAFDFDTQEPTEFDRFFETVTGRELSSLTNNDLAVSFSLLQHAADRILSEMGKRGCIENSGGHPCLPMLLPEGLDMPPTVLNGGQIWPRPGAVGAEPRSGADIIHIFPAAPERVG